MHVWQTKYQPTHQPTRLTDLSTLPSAHTYRRTQTIAINFLFTTVNARMTIIKIKYADLNFSTHHILHSIPLHSMPCRIHTYQHHVIEHCSRFHVSVSVSMALIGRVCSPHFTYLSTFKWSIILCPSDLSFRYGAVNLTVDAVLNFGCEMFWFRCNVNRSRFHYVTGEKEREQNNIYIVPYHIYTGKGRTGKRENGHE